MLCLVLSLYSWIAQYWEQRWRNWMHPFTLERSQPYFQLEDSFECAASVLELTGQQYLHGYMNHRFGSSSKSHQLLQGQGSFLPLFLWLEPWLMAQLWTPRMQSLCKTRYVILFTMLQNYRFALLNISFHVSCMICTGWAPDSFVARGVANSQRVQRCHQVP